MKKKIHVKETLFTSVLRLLVRPFCYFVLKYRNLNFYKAKRDEKLFVLSNHQTDFDPIVVRLATNRFLYSVATDNIFSNKLIGKLLSSIGGIPKKKGVADLMLVKSMLSIFNNGGSILLFPEGNRSYAEFQFYISKNLVTLIKKSKATLILYNIHGGFGVNPRFGYKKRAGRFYGEIKKVLKYDEYISMSDDELFDIVTNCLKVFDSESKDLYKSNRKAEYLERLFYVCPKCHKHSTLKSKGNVIRCTSCNLEVEYGENLHLKSHDESFTFTRLIDWYEFQKDWTRNYLPLDEIIFEDLDVTLKYAEPFKSNKVITRGKITLTKDKLIVNNLSFDLKTIDTYSPVSGKSLCFSANGVSYQIKGHPRFNPLKYIFMFNRLKLLNNEKQYDNYFTL